MHRSFASWSDNHKDINFVDVTEECAMMGKPNQDCELVELWVTSLEEEIFSLEKQLNAKTKKPLKGGRRVR